MRDFEFQPEDAVLLRIVGARKVPAMDGSSVHYAWRLVFHHPVLGDDAIDQQPRDIEPRFGQGPRADGLDPGWPAIEISGAEVPTNGSAVVWAWPDPASACLRFQYAPRRFGRIDGRETIEGEEEEDDPVDAAYTWTEVVPAAFDPDTGKFTFEPLEGGVVGEKIELPDDSFVIVNPLHDVNGSKTVPKGTVVEVLPAPVRIDPEDDPEGDGGYYQGYAGDAIVENVTTGGGGTIAEHRIYLPSAVAGSYEVTIERSNGTTYGPVAINVGDDETTLEAVFALLGIGAFGVTGDGRDFTLAYPDTESWNLPTVDARGAKGRAAWFFVSGSGLGDFFPARLSERGLAMDGRPIYGHVELDYLEDGYWEDLLKGRTGSVGAWVEIEILTTGNGVDVPATFAITIHNATSGTFKLTYDGVQTSDIAWDASSATILAALESVGPDFASAYVSADFDPHTITWTENRLFPLPSGEAYHLDNEEIPVGKRVWMRLGEVTDASASIEADTIEVMGNNYNVFDVTITARYGTYTLTFTYNSFGPFTTAALDWDADEAAIETALDDAASLYASTTVSNWAQDGDTITFRVTADDAGGTADLTIDGEALTGKRDYRFDKGVSGAFGGGCEELENETEEMQAVVMLPGATCPTLWPLVWKTVAVAWNAETCTVTFKQHLVFAEREVPA